ncbi:MAG: EndoU domain-containing protein, partial [Candidatus Dormibacteraeota bacterium]|nr:EndoU domain-containing protein [Candidatus Dormibacteraeota bacterium]
PRGRRIDRILKRYPDGSYRAAVSFYDPLKGKWVQKKGRHTMFPDHWSRDQVMAAGREAYLARADKAVKRWRGRGGGLQVRGWRREDGRGPATFYPDHGR